MPWHGRSMDDLGIVVARSTGRTRLLAKTRASISRSLIDVSRCAHAFRSYSHRSISGERVLVYRFTCVCIETTHFDIEIALAGLVASNLFNVYPRRSQLERDGSLISTYAGTLFSTPLRARRLSRVAQAVRRSALCARAHSSSSSVGAYTCRACRVSLMFAFARCSSNSRQQR